MSSRPSAKQLRKMLVQANDRTAASGSNASKTVNVLNKEKAQEAQPSESKRRRIMTEEKIAPPGATKMVRAHSGVSGTSASADSLTGIGRSGKQEEAPDEFEAWLRDDEQEPGLPGGGGGSSAKSTTIKTKSADTTKKPGGDDLDPEQDQHEGQHVGDGGDDEADPDAAQKLKLKRKRGKLRNELRKEHDEKCEELRKEFRAKFEKEKEALRLQHATKMQNLGATLNSARHAEIAKKQQAEQEKELVEQQQRHAAALKKLADRHAAELRKSEAELTGQRRAQMEQLAAKSKAELRVFQLDHEKRKEEVKLRSAKLVAECEKKRENLAAEVEREREQLLTSTNGELEERLAELKLVTHKVAQEKQALGQAQGETQSERRNLLGLREQARKLEADEKQLTKRLTDLSLEKRKLEAQNEKAAEQMRSLNLKESNFEQEKAARLKKLQSAREAMIAEDEKRQQELEAEVDRRDRDYRRNRELLDENAAKSRAALERVQKSISDTVARKEQEEQIASRQLDFLARRIREHQETVGFMLEQGPRLGGLVVDEDAEDENGKLRVSTEQVHPGYKVFHFKDHRYARLPNGKWNRVLKLVESHHYSPEVDGGKGGSRGKGNGKQSGTSGKSLNVDHDGGKGSSGKKSGTMNGRGSLIAVRRRIPYRSCMSWDVGTAAFEQLSDASQFDAATINGLERIYLERFLQKHTHDLLSSRDGRGSTFLEHYGEPRTKELAFEKVERKKSGSDVYRFRSLDREKMDLLCVPWTAPQEDGEPARCWWTLLVDSRTGLPSDLEVDAAGIISGGQTSTSMDHHVLADVLAPLTKWQAAELSQGREILSSRGMPGR